MTPEHVRLRKRTLTGGRIAPASPPPPLLFALKNPFGGIDSDDPSPLHRQKVVVLHRSGRHRVVVCFFHDAALSDVDCTMEGTNEKLIF